MYEGELIHRETDEYGKIEVIDYQKSIRSLHFGNKTQQSAMQLSNPFLLIHKYTQAMMLPTYWIYPKNVLVLGLGAGSIVKYLYNYFQNTCIDAVELRQKVIDISSKYFLLPDQDERLNIYNKSVHEWINDPQRNKHKKYDLIIVDMFLTSKNGDDIEIDIAHSLNEIYELVSEAGVVAFNHLGTDIYTYTAYNAIKKLFHSNLYNINIDSVNNVLLAMRSPTPLKINLHCLYENESKYMLPYSQYIKQLNKVY
jgi:spermidine synthase